MAIIYKITNLINNKIYIGQTIRPINVRWNEHKHESFKKDGHGYNYHLHNAIRKYGVQNFKIEQIYRCEDDNRFDAESYFIQKYNSTNPQIGYNFVVEGLGRTQYITNDILDLWGQGFLINQIAEKIGCHKSTVSNRLKNNGITQEEINQRFAKYVSLRDGKPVLQYNLNGDFIQEWPSATSCQSQGYSQSAISQVCNQKQKSAYNFLWKYKQDNRDIKQWVQINNNKKKGGKPQKTIIQFSLLDHSEIKRFPSASEAAKSLGLKDKSCICQAARKKGKSHGYYWQYQEY